MANEVPKTPVELCEADCEEIILAFETEIEFKNEIIVRHENLARLLEGQRDAAYKVAEHNPNLFDKALLGIAGVGIGCVAASNDPGTRLTCLGVSILACVLGGC